MVYQIEENHGFVYSGEVEKLVEKPGVYLMKDVNGEVIYVGKAKNLKKRVSSYFKVKKDIDPKTLALISNISIIDYFIVNNESEALILEANLIKKYSPKYNVLFKDNKSYPFIKITDEDYPRILFTRDKKNDNGTYYGPFVSAHTVRDIIEIIQKLFQIRTCNKLPKKECLNYHIGICAGPCINKITKENYKKNVEKTKIFLSRNYDKLIKILEDEMKFYSKNLMFENAQKIKEKIETLKNFESSQYVYLNKDINCDFIGIASGYGKYVILVSSIRKGIMISKRSFSATKKIVIEDENIVSYFMIDYYENLEDKPDVIYINSKYIDEVIVEFFSKEKNIKILSPVDDKERMLLKMTEENAHLQLINSTLKITNSEVLQNLQETLKLKKYPKRIEGFDIANILGQNAVASMVSFLEGKADKKNYRHFKIRLKNEPDDCAMIKEVVFRRYKRLKEEQKEFPDLILIDGGKGQLNAALSSLKELNLDIDVISLAKQNEEIYTIYNENPIILEKNNPVLNILQQIRDEAHRFANSFYNKVKGKEMIKTELEKIPGIGKKRLSILMKKIENYDIIKELKKEDLISYGIPEKYCEKVLEVLKSFII